jgi:hypothetical protein
MLGAMVSTAKFSRNQFAFTISVAKLIREIGGRGGKGSQQQTHDFLFSPGTNSDEPPVAWRLL